MILEKGFTALTAEEAQPFLKTVDKAIRRERIVIHGNLVSPFSNMTTFRLAASWDRGMSALAFNVQDEVIGHICIEHVGMEWYEIRSAWVREDYRGPFNNTGGKKKKGVHHHVGYRLYRDFLAGRKEKIFETSATPAAWKVGARLGMVPFRLPCLPDVVWKKTCHCPIERTGVHPSNNVPECVLRDHDCIARVTKETWKKIGKPAPLEISDDPTSASRLLAFPARKPFIPNDGVRIVHAW